MAASAYTTLPRIARNRRRLRWQQVGFAFVSFSSRNLQRENSRIRGDPCRTCREADRRQTPQLLCCLQRNLGRCRAPNVEHRDLFEGHRYQTGQPCRWILPQRQALLSVSFIEREQRRAAVGRLSHFQRGIFTMKNLMMVTAAVLLLSSAQARADFLADCIYQVSANTLRNATRNGQPVSMNYSRALQGVHDSSWRSCLKDQIEWVDSCVRIALSAPGPLASPADPEGRPASGRSVRAGVARGGEAGVQEAKG